MYPHFIGVTIVNGVKAIINVDHIKAVAPDPVNMDNANIYYVYGVENVAESYDEIMQLLKDAGTHIQKPDPRLDTKNPLTMDELKRMIGEPIWNSNARCWMLVGEDRGQDVMLTYNAGNGIDYTEDDLIKYPLYRMKVE